MSRSRSLPLTIVQAARLCLTTAVLCGLALSATLIGIAAQPGSARAATVTATLVKDINPAGSGGPYSLTPIGGTLFFVATDGTHGFELWKSDGTEAGTVMVKDINPGVDTFAPASLTNVDGTLFFSANDGTHGDELWKSDGTEAGTVMVKDINPASYSAPRDLTALDGTLFFSADDGTHGFELWKSDGTAAGTVMVKDITPGSGSRARQSLTARRRHPVLHRQRRDSRPRAVEERRDRRRHRAGQGHQPRTAVSPRTGSPTSAGTLFFSAVDGTHRAGAVEERRDGGRDRDGQGHQPGTALRIRARLPAWAAPCSSPPPTAPTETSCGRATGRRPGR